MNMSSEIQILKGGAVLFSIYTCMFADQALEAIKEFGSVNSDGKKSISYGLLFDKTANTRLFKTFHCYLFKLTHSESFLQWKRSMARSEQQSVRKR